MQIKINYNYNIKYFIIFLSKMTFYYENKYL